MKAGAVSGDSLGIATCAFLGVCIDMKTSVLAWSCIVDSRSRSLNRASRSVFEMDPNTKETFVYWAPMDLVSIL